MEEKYEVLGAPVISTTKKPKPYNPLIRKPIVYKPMIIAAGVYLLVLIGILLVPAELYPIPKWVVPLVWTVIYFLAVSKKAVIWLVRFYQNKASDETRLRCVFEPSCSEYMIMSVKKHGSIIGVIKGINRLLRCHPPNGGPDYP